MLQSAWPACSPDRVGAACRYSLLSFPAGAMLHLAPCPGASSSGALPHVRECVILAARAAHAREALAACRALGKAQGSQRRATPTCWIAFCCRAPFHSYKMFSPQTHVQEVHRQARRSRTGRRGAWMQAWEYQEPSQGAGMRKSGSKLGMDTWRLERGGNSCLIRDGTSQGCGGAGH